MTLFRLIPIHVHAALETAIGPAVAVAAVTLGLGPGALVAAFAIGALMLGLAFVTGGGEPGTLPVSAHAGFDALLTMALAVIAIAFAAAGDVRAAALFGVTAALHSLLSANTRYSARIS